MSRGRKVFLTCQNKKGARRPTSAVWYDFDKLPISANGRQQAKGKCCV